MRHNSFDFASFQTAQQVGLVVYDHDDNYVQVTGIRNGGQGVSFAHDVGGAAAVLGATVEPATQNLLLRLDRRHDYGPVFAGLEYLAASWQFEPDSEFSSSEDHLRCLLGRVP